MAVSRRPHAAFTLVEMLVVITILGVLMALLLPAVNSVRESMRRASCKDNLAQCGRAAQAHMAAQGYYPSDGWGANWVGDPDHGFGHSQPGGWIYNILPYTGFDMIHDVGKGTQTPSDQYWITTSSVSYTNSPKYKALPQAIAVPIPFVICPTRRRAIAYPSSALNSYYANSGAPATVGKTDYAANAGTYTNNGGGGGFPQGGTKDIPVISCFVRYPNCAWANPDQSSFNGVVGERSQVQPGHITDGLSNVFFAGEKSMAPEDYVSGGVDVGTDDENVDEQCVLMGHDDDIAGVTSNPPTRDMPGAKNTNEHFGSAHSAGVNFVFCDGHVQLISYQINTTTYKILGVRNYLAQHPGTSFPENY